jgi:transcriptional regulator with XRE-family HTH domain
MFNDWLLSQLKQLDWSQADFARASGLTTAAISRYINGRIPDEAALRKIAKAFKLPPELVFEKAGLLPPKPELSPLKRAILHLAEDLPDSDLEMVLALLDKLTELESQRAVAIAEFTELTNTHFDYSQPLTPPEIIQLAQTLTAALTSTPAEEARAILNSFIHKITVKKENGQISGFITYFAPPTGPPPFDPAPTAIPRLPKGRLPVGALLYRQHFTHPIILPDKKPRS